MWKVLGEEAVIPTIGEVWTKRMVELSKRRKDGARFVSIIEEAEVRYLFDAAREVNTFVVTLPEKYGKEDLEFMRSYVARVNRTVKMPVVEFEGREQNISVVFTIGEEEDDYAWRKSHRSDYYDWMERQSRKENEEKGQGF